MRCLVSMAAACLLAASTIMSDEPASKERHFTVRLQNRWGAHRLGDMAFSPDGRQLAIVTSGGWVEIIRTETGAIVDELQATAFGLGYSRDGGRLLLLGGKERKLYHLQQKVAYPLRGEIPTGYLGVALERRNGKVLFAKIVPSGPLARLGTVAVGDELVAVGEGEAGPMKQVIGESAKRAWELLKGPAESLVRLEVIHGADGEPKVHAVRREWREASDGRITYRRPEGLVWGENLVWSVMDGYHTFTSTSTGEIVSWFKKDPAGGVQIHALSADSRRFVILASQKDKPTELAIEVFDLGKRERESLISIPRAGYFDMAFTPDGNELALGSWDRLDFVDLDSQQIVRTMQLTDDGSDATLEQHDLDEGVGPPNSESVERAKPEQIGDKQRLTRSITHILHRLAISRTGLVASGSRDGIVRLWDHQTGKFLRQFGRNSGKEVERIIFSPDGAWMTYFVGGMLHLVDVSDWAR